MTGAAVVARRSQLAAGQGRELGELHCKLGHAVAIEPSLQPPSPENGSFSTICGRLSAISVRNRPNSESRDAPPIHNSPLLAGFSGTSEGDVSRRRTGWLGREDSNLRMVESKSGRTFNDFNDHSEKCVESDPRCLNRL